MAKFIVATRGLEETIDTVLRWGNQRPAVASRHLSPVRPPASPAAAGAAAGAAKKKEGGRCDPATASSCDVSPDLRPPALCWLTGCGRNQKLFFSFGSFRPSSQFSQLTSCSLFSHPVSTRLFFDISDLTTRPAQDIRLLV